MPKHRLHADPDKSPFHEQDMLGDIAGKLFDAHIAGDLRKYAVITEQSNHALSKSERAFVAGYLHCLRREPV